MFLADPAAIDEDGGGAIAFQGGDDHVAVVAIAGPGADEHLLIMAEAALGADAAVVKLVDGGGVDVRRQRQRLAHQAVLELGHQRRLPAQALDLPGAEGEGSDGDEGWREG